MTRIILAGCALALAGCAGTQLDGTGTACGQPFEVHLTDRKDRATFEVAITCPDGGGMTIMSSDSSTSAVIAAQAAFAKQIVAAVGGIAAAAP